MPRGSLRGFLPLPIPRRRRLSPGVKGGVAIFPLGRVGRNADVFAAFYSGGSCAQEVDRPRLAAGFFPLAWRSCKGVQASILVKTPWIGVCPVPVFFGVR